MTEPSLPDLQIEFFHPLLQIDPVGAYSVRPLSDRDAAGFRVHTGQTFTFYLPEIRLAVLGVFYTPTLGFGEMI
jgi:hypothetical protein